MAKIKSNTPVLTPAMKAAQGPPKGNAGKGKKGQGIVKNAKATFQPATSIAKGKKYQ